MPLIVKDYVWEETEAQVFITVPLKGVKANKVDILSSEEYLKVSYFACGHLRKLPDNMFSRYFGAFHV